MAVGTTNFPTSLDDAVSLPIPENNASSTLAAGINASALTITITDPSKFPDAGEFTIVDDLDAPTKIENVIIESRSGADFTVETGGRGAGGTSVQTWSAGAFIECRPNKLYYTALRSAIEAIEAKLGTGSLIDASRLADGSISNTEFQYLNGLTSAIQTQLDAKQSAFTNQSANQVYAGPASGGAAAPGFRLLVAADIPDLSASYSVVGHNHSGDYQPIDQDLTDIAALTGDGLLRRSSNVWGMDSAVYLTANQTITLSGDISGSGATSITATIGAGKVTNDMLAGSIAISKLSITGTPDGTKFLRDDGTWQVPGGGGTVTSVGLSLPAIFTVSGSPVTGSGTLTGSLAAQVANTVWAGPATGADAAPTFRALVAADIPDLSASYSVASHNHSGVYEPANANIQSHISNTSNPHSVTKSQVGLGNVENTALSTWAGSSNIATVGTITSGGLGTGAVIGGVTMTLGSDGTGDIYYRSAGGVLTRLAAGTNGHVLTLSGGLPSWAAASGGGGLTVGTTAIASGTAGRILYETSGNVLGEIPGSSATANGAISFTPTARTSGSPALPFAQFLSAADTGLSNVEQIAFQIGGDASQATVTRTLTGGGGAIALWRNALFVAPTIAASASQTITQSGTVAIAGPPIAGTNITLTSPTALLIRTNRSDQSSIRLDGSSGNTYNSIDYVTSARTFSLTGSANTWYLLDRGSGTFPFYVDVGSGYPRMGIGTSSIDTSTHLRVLSSSASRVGLRVDSAASSTVTLNSFNLATNQTNAVATHSTFAVNSSGTAATGLGGRLAFTLESTTTDDQSAAAIDWLWTDATHATRTSAIDFYGVYSAGSLAKVARMHGAGRFSIQKAADADAGTGDLSSLAGIAIYVKNSKLVFAYNNSSTMTFITIPLDGSTATWTHGTSAP